MIENQRKTSVDGGKKNPMNKLEKGNIALIPLLMSCVIGCSIAGKKEIEIGP